MKNGIALIDLGLQVRSSHNREVMYLTRGRGADRLQGANGGVALAGDEGLCQDPG